MFVYAKILIIYQLHVAYDVKKGLWQKYVKILGQVS